MKKFSSIMFVLGLMALACVGVMADTVTDLPTLVTSAQSSLTTQVWAVAPAAFTVLGILLGVGMLWRWIKKAAKAS